MTNSSTNALSVLQDVIAVNIQFSIWTGRKILDENDLSLRGEVPPKEVINLGSKHTTDPKALKVFSTLKRRAERLCLSVGIPFLGGYAIPTDKADYVAQQLRNIVNAFEHEKASYLLKHEEIQAEWIKKYPVYESILTKALTPTSDVEQRIKATFSMFKIQSADHAVSIDTGLNNQVDSLSDSLDTDILKTAKKLADSLSGAISPNQQNVRGLTALREKVEGLAFLNGRFNCLVKEIKTIEGKLPITGQLSKDETHLLSGMLFRMSDKQKLDALMTNLNENLDKSVTTQPSLVVTTPSNAEDEQSIDRPFDANDFEFDVGTVSNEALINPALNSTFF